eukprot:6189085-Pleurochrysis_carterae.AAC.5
MSRVGEEYISGCHRSKAPLRVLLRLKVWLGLLCGWKLNMVYMKCSVCLVCGFECRSAITSVFAKGSTAQHLQSPCKSMLKPILPAVGHCGTVSSHAHVLSVAAKETGLPAEAESVVCGFPRLAFVTDTLSSCFSTFSLGDMQLDLLHLDWPQLSMFCFSASVICTPRDEGRSVSLCF